MSESLFAAAVNCMDGRVQLPVIEWMKEKFQVQYVDMITEAGAEKVILEGTELEIASVRSRLQVSCEAHGSEVAAVIGHHGCAGNPVSKDEKLVQIKKAVDVINSWEFPMKVLGLYVNENWEVELVSE